MGERPRLATIGGVAVEAAPQAGDTVAFGRLAITGDITGLSGAHLFGARGRQTRVTLRFSDADGARGPIGFTARFHTAEGDWELPGTHSPVAFRRDPRSPLPLGDAWSGGPESLHQLTILFSDRGRPATLRHMHGFGGQVLGLTHPTGRRVWCKFRFRSMQGIRGGSEAGHMPMGHRRRDLLGAIGRGEFPRWRMMIQIMGEEEARDCPFDPFDATKIWPHRRWPPIEVGVLELDANAEASHAQVFSSAHLVPGIGPAPDRRPGPDLEGDFAQPGTLFRLMNDAQRASLMEAIAASMAGLPEAIQRRQIGHFARADPAYGAGVARRLGLGLTLAAG